MSPIEGYDLSWKQLWRMLQYLNPDTRLKLIELARRGARNPHPEEKQGSLVAILDLLGEDITPYEAHHA